MGLPGKRRSSSSKRRRAAHFALTKPLMSKCPQCGKDMRPHYACQHCGYYRGRQIVTTLKKNKTLTRSTRASKAPASSK